MAIGTPNTPPKVDKIEIAIPKDNGKMDEQTLLFQDALKEWYFTAEIQKNLQKVKDEVEISKDPQKETLNLIDYLLFNPQEFTVKWEIQNDDKGTPFEITTIELTQHQYYKYMGISHNYPTPGEFKIDLISHDPTEPAITVTGTGELPTYHQHLVTQKNDQQQIRWILLGIKFSKLHKD